MTGGGRKLNDWRRVANEQRPRVEALLAVDKHGLTVAA